MRLRTGQPRRLRLLGRATTETRGVSPILLRAVEPRAPQFGCRICTVSCCLPVARWCPKAKPFHPARFLRGGAAAKTIRLCSGCVLLPLAKMRLCLSGKTRAIFASPLGILGVLVPLMAGLIYLTALARKARCLKIHRRFLVVMGWQNSLSFFCLRSRYRAGFRPRGAGSMCG